MLQLYDKNHVKIEGLTKYKDYNIESVLSSGDKTLSFVYPTIYSDNIQEEGYIRTKTAEFVVKQIEGKTDWKTIKATLNVEDLEGKPWDRFDSTEQTITDCLNLALAGTGWSVGTCNVTKLRTVRKTGCSAWDIVQEAIKTYRVEVEFDTLNKVINIYDKMGSDKGTYFIDSLNLKALTVQRDSYSYYTRIQAVGKDGLTLPASGYVENYQYSNKIKTLYWKDERYTDVTSLTEDATLKLDEISKPYRAYGADIIDLAKASDKYKDILSYSLGDTVSLISKDMKVKEKQRIAKITEYPDEPERNACELANVILGFEDVQKENQETTDTVNNITEDNGTVSQGAISQAVNNLTVQQFSAVTGRIGTLETTTAHITNGIIDNATIGVEHVNDIYANYAHITNGRLDNAIIGTEQVENSAITNAKIANEAVGTSQIQLGAITQALIGNEAVGSSQIANLSVGDAKIIDLSLSKLKAGDISTTKFRIVSDSGNMLISDNTLQISDATRVRVQIGKDASNDYNMYVWDTSGNLMFDATGLKASGIKDKIIRDDMVSDTANINAAKIDIDSMFSQMNSNGTSTLKGSKIYLDTQAQTLDVQFTSLSNTVSSQGTTITSQGTSIGVIQGQISSKIWQTDIDTAADNLQTQIDDHTTEISQNTTDISLKASQSSLDTTNSNVSNLTGRMSTAEASINVNAQNIALKVSTSDYTGNNITSLINQSATTIKLQASKIDLSGYVTISSLQTAGSVTINGGNISGGTLTLGGANNIQGSFTLLDGEGNIGATIDKDGFNLILNTDSTGLVLNNNFKVCLNSESTPILEITPYGEFHCNKSGVFDGLTIGYASGMTGGGIQSKGSIKTNGTIQIGDMDTGMRAGGTNGTSLIAHSEASLYLRGGGDTSGVSELILGVAGTITYNGYNVWHAGNDGSGSGLDADKLDGLQPSASATVSTIVERNASGHIYAVGVNSTISATTTAATSYWVETGSDNWIRPKSLANVRVEILAAGGTMGGDLALSNGSDLLLKAASATPTDAGDIVFENSSSSELARIYNGSGNYLSVRSDGNVFCPANDNTTYLGLGSNRWKQIFAGTSTISTSDRNEKNTIVSISEQKAIALIMTLNPVTYKFNDGDSGRTHWGMVSQDVYDEILSIGLTDLDFAGFIRDKKYTHSTDDKGHDVLTEVIGENSYGLRYEEFIAPIIKVIQVQQRKIQELEQRINVLEAS